MKAYTLLPHATPAAGRPPSGPEPKVFQAHGIAGFAVDAATGHLTSIGHVATEAVPSAFGLDPAGSFV